MASRVGEFGMGLSMNFSRPKMFREKRLSTEIQPEDTPRARVEPQDEVASKEDLQDNSKEWEDENEHINMD